MMYRFGLPLAFFILVPALLCILLLRRYYRRATTYYFPYTTFLINLGGVRSHPFHRLFFISRLCVLIVLIFLIARPQLMDVNAPVLMEGIDIALVLDASGSMNMPDMANDQRSRFDVAKEEAIRFVSKRKNDAIGLVIFGKQALSRCPLTHDKRMLLEMIRQLRVNQDVEESGTALATAVLTAANRLKSAKATSKIMILLTDGAPSEGDIDMQAVLAIAKKMGIKIYTIGIGSDKPHAILTPYGPVMVPCVNRELLQHMAATTGGRFFMARDETDMRAIYDTIDQLEKTSRDVPQYTRYYDIFLPFVGVLLGILCLEALLSATVWFGV